MWPSARRPGRTVFGITGQKVTPSGCFPAECLRLHYGGKPPPRPPPRNYSRFSLLLRIAPAAFPADRFRPAACRKSSAVGFAVRSGLISKAQLFSPEELTQLYRATDYLLDEGPEPEDGQLKALQTSRTKIEYTVPDLAERLEQSQGQEPQMNL